MRRPDRLEQPDIPTEQERFRRGERRRILFALIGAIIVLALGIILGPRGEQVRRRWEFSGSEGPMKLMPELSIDDGADERHQDPARSPDTPPSAPNIEVITPEARESVAPPSPPSPAETPVDPAEIEPDAELDVADAIEMRLPSQTNPWFRLIRMVRPRYPADADVSAMTAPQIAVEVAFYVNEEGRVTGSYIMSNSGGEPFARVVLKAVDQWLYEPVVLPDGNLPQGFWNRLTIYFRSPVRPAPGAGTGNPGLGIEPGVR